jgi:hypothetical protein
MPTDEPESSAVALRGGADATDASAPLLWLRAFGSRPGDLDVDLSTEGPQAVTEVLVRCARAGTVPATQQALEALTVGTRTRALLMVAAATRGEPLQVVQRCTACRESMEMDVPLPEIAQFGAGTASRVSVVHAGQQWVVRLPSGIDQRRWASAGISNPIAMATSLIVEGDGSRVDATWLERLGSALRLVDPLIDFTLRVQCPACRAPHSVPVDLQECALTELRRTQRALMVAVHRLASAYHWNEADIVAMPAWRRDNYVAWVEPESAWS